MLVFDLDEFIRSHVTGRSESLFRQDVEANLGVLQSEVEGRSALVIGGAGSIGSSFIKMMLPFRPARLFVVDISENCLAELTRDLLSLPGLHIPTEFKTFPINFGDRLFARLVEREGPFDIVANFAAHKHVRSEKDQYSISAMVENNVLRNHALLELLAASPPRHFFCVSTDKAANPVNVMGASKKLMEELLLAYSDTLPVSSARFANVAFSQGSLLDGFLHRLQKQQPLSAPRDVRRYFVSPQESGQLCLLACILGRPGEIFFPKLAEDQMKTFSGIAELLLGVLGRSADRCECEEEARQKAAALHSEDRTWPVFFFDSDTSGEKPYEEFVGADEQPDLSRFKSLGVVSRATSLSRSRAIEIVETLRQLLNDRETGKADFVAVLENLLPGFHHRETGKSLDEKM